jgi:hypothetical protein
MSRLLPRSVGSGLYLVALMGVAGSLVLVAIGAWRWGVGGVGVVFLLTAVARVFVSEAHVGMLQVRSKTIDVLMLTLLGCFLIALAITVPPYRS